MNNYLAIKSVIPGSDYTLKLTFENAVEKTFDMKPYLHLGVFRKLQDVDVFNQVKVKFDSIAWPFNIDFDPETLWEDGVE